VRNFIGILISIAAFTLTACSQPQPPPAQQVTINCPSDSTCDPKVDPPPYTSAQIQAHANARDMDDEILMALMIQDMSWRQCYGCYDSYYSRYPAMQQRVYYVQNLPSNQRATYVQQNNTTIIQKNTTVIQQKAAADPPALKAQPATVSGQNGGTGGGTASTNKVPGGVAPAPAAPAQVTKPAAPPAPAPPVRAPAAPPPAPAPKR
jgi:hypothetical protein